MDRMMVIGASLAAASTGIFAGMAPMCVHIGDIGAAIYGGTLASITAGGWVAFMCADYND